MAVTISSSPPSTLTCMGASASAAAACSRCVEPLSSSLLARTLGCPEEGLPKR
jgi:hypothetical protein